MTQEEVITALAAHFGIEESYYNLEGQLCVTSHETRLLLLAAMGLEVEGAAAQRTLEHERAREAAALVPASRVLEARATPVLRIPLEATDHARVLHATLALEAGEKLQLSATQAPQATTIELALPGALPLGYHKLRLALDAAGSARAPSEQHLIVVPERAAAARARATGLCAQLYSTRGERDAGAGDFATLRELVDFAGLLELDFVALSPLFALDFEARDVSPYAPTSRLALHPLYLDLGAPVVAQGAGARARRVDYQAVVRSKLERAQQLGPMWLLQAASSSQGSDSAQVSASIDGYATFTAIAEQLGEPDFTRWPSELQRPDSAEAQSLARSLHERIAFHRALQLALDAQLGLAAARARAAGLCMGLVTDFPVGSAAGGADVWSEHSLFARGACLGAPPDAYARDGQSWGLPPLIPWRSQRQGHRLFAALVRRAMRHAGAVRIDHVMGLVRQYWVPAGHSGRQGAYVRGPRSEPAAPFPDDWLGIVALESARSGCAVLGEDLGTVPAGLREELSRRGMLRSHVALFERAPDSAFLDPRGYAPEAMASVLTHDLPSLRELWEARDLARKQALGLLDDAQRAAAEHERELTRWKLVDALHTAGTLGRDEPWPDPPRLHRALCEWIAATPALLALDLDDIADEPEGVNIPGTGPEVDNWKRRMTRTLAELRADEPLCAWLRALARSRRASAS
jgi:4-alpha-glucanotransferase